MAMRNLLQIAQTSCDELGIDSPQVIAGSTDAQAKQIMALLNREGVELSLREGSAGGWPQLRMEWTQTLSIGVDNYAFAEDLNYFINTTAWDRDQKWPMQGPISPQVWQVLKSGTIGSVGPRTRFRLMEGRIYFDPVPTVGNDVVIEYYRNTWCTDVSGATPKTRFAVDTDVPVLPDDAFILGLKWRFRRAKGLDYTQEHADYENFVGQALGRATMAPVLSLDGSYSLNRFIDEGNIPDSGYG